MNIFYLIRHAHADWNPDEQRPLSRKGQQAAQHVATLLGQLPITAIYSSPARRAHQTILPLAQRLDIPISHCDDLAERRLAATPVDNFEQAVLTTWQQPDYAFPGGESNTTAQQRGVRVIEHLVQAHPNKHIALATHGNLLALILQHFDTSIDIRFWQGLSMPDIYQLTLEEQQPHQIRRLWQIQ